MDQLFTPPGWIFQLVFITHQNPEEVGSNSSEGMDLPEKSKEARAKVSLLHILIEAAIRRFGAD